MVGKMTRRFGAALMCGLLLAGCGDTTDPGATGNGGEAKSTEDRNMEPQGVDGRPSLDEFCGDKPAKVAYIVGFGENAWRKTTLAEIQDEAGKCDNVTVEYFNANGDQNQYLSMVNSATAQGFNAIITYDDFGAAANPAFRQAEQAGVVVIPFEADPTGEVGKDYTGFVSLDTAFEAEAWAGFFGRALPDGGKIAFLGGTPGAPLSKTYWTEFSGHLKDLKNTELQGQGPITTNWTPADSQKAASGLFSQFPDTTGLIVDYLGGSGPATVNAFQNAKQPLVPIAGGSATNQIVCQFEKLTASNPKFALFSMDGDVAIGRVALRHAVAAYEGIDNDESWVFQRSVGIDTTQEIVPPCQADMPPDLPLNSTLSEDQLKQVFTG
jgi:ribose transport system substrate-binding protein